MDKVVYTIASGLDQLMNQQATNANNLANVSTYGFKAQIDTMRSVAVNGPGSDTRAFAASATTGTDFTPGTIQQTGRPLDVAIEGKGWFAVQRPSGGEGLTRNGAFKISENGILQTANGLNVLGDGGPITIPPNVTVSIGEDGTISSVDESVSGRASTPIDKLKLVNPEEANLVRGVDGLFNNKDLSPTTADTNVKVVGSSLETSNVSVVKAMVNMIALARQFDVQMTLAKNAESNDQTAAKVFNIS
ncbi:flagellar basal-body rod protein FlgF [Polynucleobacter paneuropaeus]|nr:flagellar basal-body rod protein FlgF [Polynucleobacter paneuropaeus]QWD06455.1 flagellar basal-body rod protein FlgF [Polynucleobacter paneuropaeus]